MSDIKELIQVFNQCLPEKMLGIDIVITTAADGKIQILDKKILDIQQEIDNELQGLVSFFVMKMETVEMLLNLKESMEKEKKSATRDKEMRSRK